MRNLFSEQNQILYRECLKIFDSFEFQNHTQKSTIRTHSLCVLDEFTSCCYKTQIDEICPNWQAIGIISALFHDIGKTILDKGHAQVSLKLINNLSLSAFTDNKMEIADCILNHGTDKKPVTLIGRIFRLCDKSALKHPLWIAYKESE
ncbi:HD domain-containing protein [Candidatus Woesearchaeota archaeon]|nr:HD domain-containing protein [Candidatus Woesearchaeota archaeon]